MCYLLRGNPVYLEMIEQSRALTPSTKRGAIIAMQLDIFPIRGCAIPAESHKRSNHNKSSGNTESKKVATVVSENSKAQNEGKERISKLCEALKQSMNL